MSPLSPRQAFSADDPSSPGSPRASPGSARRKPAGLTRLATRSSTGMVVAGGTGAGAGEDGDDERTSPASGRPVRNSDGMNRWVKGGLRGVEAVRLGARWAAWTQSGSPILSQHDAGPG